MGTSVDWHVLARYLADACSSEEASAIDAWLDADPTRRQLMEELKTIWEASDAPVSRLDDATLEADWKRLAAAMDASEASAVPPSAAGRTERAPRRRRSARSHTSVLQSALYLILFGLLVVGSAWLGWMQWGPLETPFREVVAERGERANIQLADGTRVTLNVDSRLRIPTTFDADTRSVYLEGEAYFDVATDSTRPFIVHANDAVINVHGTSFNVRSYPEDQRVEVAVVEGAVSLRPQQVPPDDEGARLEPGQVGQLERNATRVTTQTVSDVSPLLGWVQGRLVFEDAPLSEVAARLERWYNLRFHLADPRLDSLRLTANLKSRSVHNVLDVVSASLDIQYRIQNNTVILADNRPPHSQ